MLGCRNTNKIIFLFCRVRARRTPYRFFLKKVSFYFNNLHFRSRKMELQCLAALEILSSRRGFLFSKTGSLSPESINAFVNFRGFKSIAMFNFCSEFFFPLFFTKKMFKGCIKKDFYYSRESLTLRVPYKYLLDLGCYYGIFDGVGPLRITFDFHCSGNYSFYSIVRFFRIAGSLPLCIF